MTGGMLCESGLGGSLWRIDFERDDQTITRGEVNPDVIIERGLPSRRRESDLKQKSRGDGVSQYGGPASAPLGESVGCWGTTASTVRDFVATPRAE